MIMQISIAVLVLALCVLVYSLVQTLREAQKALHVMTDVMSETREQVEVLGTEVRSTLRNVNEVTRDVKTKMTELHSVFETVGHIGRLANEATTAVEQTAAGITRTVKEKLAQPSVRSNGMWWDILRQTAGMAGQLVAISNAIQKRRAHVAVNKPV